MSLRSGSSAKPASEPLDESTWDAFAELVERNNGVYGGCWCIAHHSEYQRGVSDPRTLKEALVRGISAPGRDVRLARDRVAWFGFDGALPPR